jgi:hypothetical protein
VGASACGVEGVLDEAGFWRRGKDGVEAVKAGLDDLDRRLRTTRGPGVADPSTAAVIAGAARHALEPGGRAAPC